MKNKRIFAGISGIIVIAAIITFSITTCASMTIAEVEWDTLEGPQKVRQFLGIDNSEVRVFVVYKNGDRRQTRAGSLRYNKDIAGPQTVIVNISGNAGGSFQTEVMELTSIRIERPPTKTSYTVGERASLSGIRVMGTWEGMPDAEIPFSQLRAVEFNSSVAGSTDITVSYNGMNASFPVTVTARSAATASAAASNSTGQSVDPEWQLMLDRINLLVDNHFQNRDFDEGQKTNWNITGLSVGIYKNGRTAFFNRGYHESERRNVANRRPVTENSIFLIGSVSKPVSNILFSYFSRINNPRTGRPYVNLNDSINNYFPTKPYIDTDGTHVYPTLLQFATHYAGVPRYVGTRTFVSLENFKSTLENLTYVCKPGTASNYSMGAAVVANVIASVYYNDFPKRKSGDLLTEHLFRPLGMNSSMLHGWVNPAMRDRLALPHNFSGTARSLNLSEDKSTTLIGASGEITSTASDMMRLAAFILGDQVPAGAEVLQQAAAAGIGWRTSNRSVPVTAFTPHESNIASLGGRVRELFTRPANSGQRYGRTLRHGGTISGYQTYMMICPDTKTAVVVMVNNRKARGNLAQQIMDRVLNATYSGRRTAFDDFDDRIATYNRANANVDIVLNEDLTIEAPINHIRAPARAGATLTIRSANPARPVTLTRGTSGDLFTVPSGVTLIFRDIIIDGGGSIILSEVDDDDDDDDDEEGEGADTAAEVDEEGNPLTKPAVVVAGSLVRVNSGGTFIMESGALLRNNINSGNGGGVYVNTNGTFTMNSGVISGNTASGNGGGVVVTNSAVFTMNGGEISGNSGANGGGMRISARGVFTLTNGKISGNTASGDGGGVSVTNTGSTLNINGGEISGNTGKDGGGIRLSGGTFTMRGGSISGNTANLGGGGASVSGSNSVFNFIGGSISGNTSVTNPGGGIAMWSSATVTMSGGEIIGNNAPSGNGVRRAGGTFNLNGGAIAGTGANISAIMSGTYNLNAASPNNAVIIAWNRPSGASGGTLNYTVGANTNLTVSAGGTATWQNQNGVLGISYTNGANRGWIRAW